jgi:thiol-disulfide isomerase/thioredoxin
VRESKAVTDQVRRATRLVAQHKLGAAMAALLVLAAIVGVASGSLNGASPGTAGAPPATQPAAAPAFTLAALGTPGQGGPAGLAMGSRQVSLSQYQGRPLIVNFWASWCVPCQQETPLLASFYKAHGGQVVIVGVDANDSTAKAIAFLQAKRVTYPIGADPHLAIADAYDVAAFPQTFFLDAAHHVVDRVFGPLTTARLDKGVQLMTAKDDTSGTLRLVT